MYVAIDRLEGGLAVLEDEDGNLRTVERGQLPAEARAGDVLAFDGSAYRIDQEETQRRRDYNRRLEELLKGKRPD